MSTEKRPAISAILLLCLIGQSKGAGCEQRRLIQFPQETSIALLVSDDGDFLGVGAIKVEGIQLCPRNTPMRIQIVGRDDKYDFANKPDVIEYRKAKLEEVNVHSNSAFAAVGLESEDGSIDKLRMVFEFVNEKFYESDAIGIKYHFEWESEKRYAHQVRETSYWNFGDSVDGLRMISQNSGYGRASVDFVIGADIPIGGYRLAGVVETADISRTISASGANPITFAYIPQKEARETRQGDGDYVTFFGRQEKGISFLRYADTATMNYWQYERQGGKAEIKFEEWYCVPLAKRIKTAPIVVQVLHKTGVNAWIDAKEVVRAKLLAAERLPDLDPWPWVAYSPKLLDPADGEDRNRRWLSYEQTKATLKEAGIKEFWWYGPWKSNWSEIDRMTPEEIEKHKPVYSHAVWDYDWARNKYDVDGIEKMTKELREDDIGLAVWATQTMSQCSPLVYKHPDWMLRRLDGSLFDYVYRDIAGVNHHSNWSDYYVDRMVERRSEIPFDSIWMDSFFFSADIIDWMDVDLYPNFNAALGTIKKLLKAGFRRIYTEHHSPFALSSATGYMDRKKMLTGKQLYLLHNTALCDHLGNQDLECSPEVYFKLLAFKCCPQTYLRHYVNNPEFLKLAGYANKAYWKALPYTKKCIVLEDDQGTMYLSKDRRNGIVFAFKDGHIDLGKKVDTAEEILSSESVTLEENGVLVEAHKVYRVSF